MEEKVLRKYAIQCVGVLLLFIATLGVQAEERDLSIYTENKENRLIYCITSSQESPYGDVIESVCKNAGEKLEYRVESYRCKDSLKKKALFDQAIEEKASFIICDNQDGRLIEPAIVRAKDAGIAVFVLNQEAADPGICAGQIVSDEEQGLTELAEYLIEQTGGEGAYLELNGLEVMHTVLDDTNMECVGSWTVDLKSKKSGKIQKRLEKLLMKEDSLKAIVCGDDQLAMLAMEAVENVGLDREVFITGFGGSNPVRDAIRDGDITATSLQQVSIMVEMAVEQGDELMKKGVLSTEEEQFVACKLINRDNVSLLNNFTYGE